jgi:dephospho-CoA kinase
MIIGLTGGIGSGKSVISNQLRQMGYSVYDTDSEAKRLIMEDVHVREQIEHLFGKDVYRNGVYQTAMVAQQVFANPSLLARLNAIVHPAVHQDIIRWVSKQNSPSFKKGKGVSLLFIECAILYQAGIDQFCDKVVAVTAPEQVRLERVIARDHSTIDEVRARMRAQEIEKDLQRADLVVNNDGKTEIMVICLQIQDFFRNFAG